MVARRLGSVLVTTALIVLVSSCRSQSAPPLPPEDATSTGLERGAGSYFLAYLDGDSGATYYWLSRACTAKFTKDAWVANQAKEFASLQQATGHGLSDFHIGHITAGTTTGSAGSVTVDLAGSPNKNTVTATGATEGRAANYEIGPQNWVYEDGRWLLADCPDASGSPGSTPTTR